jgi:lysozyme
MNITDAGLSLIKQSEGFRSMVYNDVAGKPTIGYGHLLKASESFPNGITEEHATALLRFDVAWAEHAVTSMVKVPLTQGQFYALVDFTFNLGIGTLQRSSVLSRQPLQQGRRQGMRWIDDQATSRSPVVGSLRGTKFVPLLMAAAGSYFYPLPGRTQ